MTQEQKQKLELSASQRSSHVASVIERYDLGKIVHERAQKHRSEHNCEVKPKQPVLRRA
jgi:hypothetical protein